MISILEVIVRQMTRKVKVEEPGDTDLLPGTMIDMFDLKMKMQELESLVEKKPQGEDSITWYN